MAGAVEKAKTPVNPWRGETRVELPGASLKLRCTMESFAHLLSSLECETLIEVFRKWDGLSPDVIQASTRLLAEDPAAADKFWPHVNGQAGLTALHAKFYEVVSGRTAEELASENASRKKIEAWFAGQNAETVAQIAAVIEAGQISLPTPTA